MAGFFFSWRVGARLKKEYAYLEAFTRDLVSKRYSEGSRRPLSRAASYTNNVRLAHFEHIRQSATRAGVTILARRVTGPVETEHCRGCLSEAAFPPRPIERVAPVGSKECGRFCKCRIVLVRQAES